VATGGLRADLTVLLDVPPEIGLQRLTGPGDRMESETVAFHQRVRRTFLSLSTQSRGRYLVLDAQTSVEKIHEVVVARTLQLLLARETPQDAPRSLAESRP
jgi:dTMP kinase